MEDSLTYIWRPMTMTSENWSLLLPRRTWLAQLVTLKISSLLTIDFFEDINNNTKDVKATILRRWQQY